MKKNALIFILILFFVLSFFSFFHWLEEDIILLNISNKTIFTYFTLGKGLSNADYDFYEGIKIMPHYPFLKFSMYYLFEPLKPVLHGLDKNVSFLEIDEKYNNVRISCDWCSIINGMLETAKQNIINNSKIVENICFDKMKTFEKYLNFALNYRKVTISDNKIQEWCRNTFHTISDNHLLFSRIYLKTELLELRWCPFKRSKETYYRNKDPRYLEPTEKIMYEIGKILNDHETITCNNCPNIVNTNWKYTKNREPSIFQPLLDYMMKEIDK